MYTRKWKPSTTLFHRIKETALFSQRSLLTLMALTGLANSYLMRLCLNLSMWKMIDVKSSNEATILLREHPNFLEHTRSTMMDGSQMVEFSAFQSTTKSTEWSTESKNLLKSAFFIGYALLQIPGSFIGQKYGGKTIFNLALLSTALCTLLTPVVAQYGGANGLITLRFLMGFSETPAYPALVCLLSCWIPKSERGRVSSIVFCGGQIGSIIYNLLIGFASKYIDGSYGSIFYTLGILGMLWNIAFHFLVYNTPSSHPRITVEEREYLQNEIGELVQTKTFLQIPWTSMISSPTVWVLILALMGHDWGFYILATELPNYLKCVLNFNRIELAWYTSIPFVVSYMFSILCGICCDNIVNEKRVTRTRARKFFTGMGAIMSASFTLLIYHVQYDKTSAVFSYTFAMGFMGAFYTGVQANFLDLCPNYSGALMGLVSGTGGVCGFLAPYLTGQLTTKGEYWEWGAVFWTSFVILLTTLLTYFKWASGEVQPWNDSIDGAERAKEAMKRLLQRKVQLKEDPIKC